MSNSRLKLFCGVYTHPSKRGFSLNLTREGWVSFKLLFWKWEVSANLHGLACCEKYLGDYFKEKWEKEERLRRQAEESLNRMRAPYWNYE